jgi:hypothetical protein
MAEILITENPAVEPTAGAAGRYGRTGCTNYRDIGGGAVMLPVGMISAKARVGWHEIRTDITAHGGAPIALWRSTDRSRRPARLTIAPSPTAPSPHRWMVLDS